MHLGCDSGPAVGTPVTASAESGMFHSTCYSAHACSSCHDLRWHGLNNMRHAVLSARHLSRLQVQKGVASKTAQAATSSTSSQADIESVLMAVLPTQPGQQQFQLMCLAALLRLAGF